MNRSATQNLQLLQTIEANRAFMLAVNQQNPNFLETAEDRIRALFGLPPRTTPDEKPTREKTGWPEPG